MPNILILGGGLQALALTKSLFNAGHHSSIATSKTDVAYYCRYVHERYAIPVFQDSSLCHRVLLS